MQLALPYNLMSVQGHPPEVYRKSTINLLRETCGVEFARQVVGHTRAHKHTHTENGGLPKFIERARNGPTASRSKATRVNCLPIEYFLTCALSSTLLCYQKGRWIFGSVRFSFYRHTRQNNHTVCSDSQRTKDSSAYTVQFIKI